LGEHLLQRRAKARLTQGQVARLLRVSTGTYLLWETARTTPTTRYYPAILGFLGYDPFPAPTSLPERIAAKRRLLGLSIEKAARLIDVDEGTFRRWESGEWKPRLSQELVARFLATRLT
jgi:transcriptional regulator with XRE-family HTH domain